MGSHTRDTESIQLSAQQITSDAKQTGQQLADMATLVIDESFTDRITENVGLFVDHHCGPGQYREAGQLAGRFYNAGRKHSAILTLGYFVIMSGCVGVALWMTTAPLWLYLPCLAGSLVFALVFSLSGTKAKP
ncbi:MAG: hypothetical protein AAGA46_03390 [Cyanobacteria bacterium P01_F01_bin.13]